jgi:hypothetical protein
MTMNRIHAAISCGLYLAVTLGCGSERQGPTSAAGVKGTVLLDNKRVLAAEVHFILDGVPPRVMQVKDGTFSGEAPVGKNKVEVYIYVDGPPSEKYPSTLTKINKAPDRYWGPNTILQATVEEGGANDFKLELTSP